MQEELARILKTSFDRYHDIPYQVWHKLAGKFEPVIYSKKEVIKHQNTTEKYLHFLLSGSAGIFLWREKSFVCLDLAINFGFCCDYFSLLQQSPTPLHIQALEESKMMRLPRHEFYKLGENPDEILLRQVAAEASFIAKQKQQIDLMTKTAAERYDELDAENPGIHQRIAQKHISSYLGVTTQSLSRIRRQRDRS